MYLLDSGYDWDYLVEPQEKGNSFLRHARAKVLGGCSTRRRRPAAARARHARAAHRRRFYPAVPAGDQSVHNDDDGR
jgi:hypothetical protein